MDSPRLRRSILLLLGFSMRSARVDMGTPVAVRFVPTVGGQLAGVGIAAAIGAAKADVGRLGGRIDQYSEYWFKAASKSHGRCATRARNGASAARRAIAASLAASAPGSTWPIAFGKRDGGADLPQRRCGEIAGRRLFRVTRAT
jgi:hypothetical protein